VLAGVPNERELTLQREARVTGLVRGPDGRALASTSIHTGAPELFANSST